ARENLRSRGAVAVHEHGKRPVVGHTGLDIIQYLEASGRVLELHDRAAIDEQTRERDRLRQVAATVVTQVDYQTIDILALELIEQPPHVARGAAIVLVAGALRRNVLVEPRNRDHADLVGLAVALDRAHFLARGRVLEDHLVADEHELLFRRAWSG